MKMVAIVGKQMHKIVLLMTKYIPFLVMLLYMFNNVFSYLHYDSLLFSIVGGMSILPIIYFLVTSVTFRFCVYHRLPIYYVILSDCIYWYDIIYGIPLSSRDLFGVHLFIANITIILMIYLKFRVCKKDLKQK